jgi:hypothetical protein
MNSQMVSKYAQVKKAAGIEDGDENIGGLKWKGCQMRLLERALASKVHSVLHLSDVGQTCMYHALKVCNCVTYHIELDLSEKKN